MNSISGAVLLTPKRAIHPAFAGTSSSRPEPEADALELSPRPVGSLSEYAPPVAYRRLLAKTWKDANKALLKDIFEQILKVTWIGSMTREEVTYFYPIASSEPAGCGLNTKTGKIEKIPICLLKDMPGNPVALKGTTIFGTLWALAAKKAARKMEQESLALQKDLTESKLQKYLINPLKKRFQAASDTSDLIWLSSAEVVSRLSPGGDLGSVYEAVIRQVIEKLMNAGVIAGRFDSFFLTDLGHVLCAEYESEITGETGSPSL